MLSALAGVGLMVVILTFGVRDFNERTVIGTLAIGVGVTLVGGLVILIRAMRTLDRRVKRHEAGQCVECGYDLRGSQESGRCPECGASFKLEP
jgi:hypothetical protein